MPAWKHFKRWSEFAWLEYRKHVGVSAPQLQGRNEDCADLSMLLLIEFASKQGLPVSFEDNDGNRYSSSEDRAVYFAPGWPSDIHIADWNTSEKFYVVVKRRIGSKGLYKRNTVANYAGPAPGDLLLTESHCALVYRVYPPGIPHPQWNNPRVPSFPGGDTAMEQGTVTEYFKGTTVPYPQDVTSNRGPDKDYHFDYLNSRGNAKRKAELIYFANARQALQAGFAFCQYSAQVLER